MRRTILQFRKADILSSLLTHDPQGSPLLMQLFFIDRNKNTERKLKVFDFFSPVLLQSASANSGLKPFIYSNQVTIVNRIFTISQYLILFYLPSLFLERRNGGYVRTATSQI